MKFLEYLKEDRDKDLYTIVNTRDGSVPRENGEPFKTWAVSDGKAKAQIMHRMRQTPDKYSWKVINNPEDYQAITWDQYKKMEIDLETAHMQPSVSKFANQPQQLDMFNDPTNTNPYGSMN
jgi:hypothetical protein